MKSRLHSAVEYTKEDLESIRRTVDDIDRWLRGDSDEDVVNSPSHYKIELPFDGVKIEAIEYIAGVLGPEGAVDYCVGSALKYLSRAGRKAGNSRAQDLRKAAWFCTTGAQYLEHEEKP